MAAKIVAKLRGLDFNPKRIFSLPEETRSLDLGILVGVAAGTSKYTMDDGSTSYGFLGAFEYRDFDTTIAPKASGRVFMHESITSILREPVEEAVEEQNKGGPRCAVRFAFKVSAVRDSNPQGYSWAYEPLVPIGTSDPLAEIRAALPETYRPPVIEDQATKQIPQATGTIEGETVDQETGEVNKSKSKGK